MSISHLTNKLKPKTKKSNQPRNQKEKNPKRAKRCNTNDASITSKPNSAGKVTRPKRQLQTRSRKAATSTKRQTVSETNPLDSIGLTNDIPVQLNKVSASLSAAHIIDSNRIHNTRPTKPNNRKRTNPRSARSRTKVDYSNFYSSDDNATESSPSRKRMRTTAEISLREPTEARIKAQNIITRKRLQEMSPTGNRVRLIGTVTSPKPLLSPKIKTENIKRENNIKSEKQLEIDDYMAKGMCLSAHSDGSPCANIQNPNNVNFAPMSIREHRRKQRAEKALFLAGLLAKRASTNRNAVTETTPKIPDNSDIQSSVVTTSITVIPKLSELCARNVVTNIEPDHLITPESIPQEQSHDLDRNGVTVQGVTRDVGNLDQDAATGPADLDVTLDYIHDTGYSSGDTSKRFM